MSDQARGHFVLHLFLQARKSLESSKGHQIRCCECDAAEGSDCERLINLLHCRQHHAISTSTIEINDAEGTQLRFWSWLCGQATGDLFTRTGLVLHTLSEGIPWMLPGKYQFYEAHVALKGRPGTDVAWKPPLWPAQHEERSLSRALVRCNRTRNAHGLHGSCLATPSRRRHVSSHGQLDIPH